METKTINTSIISKSQSIIQMEEKKEYLPPSGTSDVGAEENSFTPISARATNNYAPSARLAISRTTTQGTSRSRYHGGQDGYSVFTHDESPENGIENSVEVEPEFDFVVKWDGGDADPLNPRNRGTLRKWLIVFVVSLSSLCV